MKKQLAILGLCVGFVGLAQNETPEAEPKTEQRREVEVEINGNDVVMRGDAGAEMGRMVAQMQREIAKIEERRARELEKINQDLKDGKITAEQAEARRERANDRAEEETEALEDRMEVVSEAFEDQWEAWAEEYEARMEAWEDELEARMEQGQGPGAIPPMPPMPPMPMMRMNVAPSDTTDPEASDSSRTVIIGEEGIVIKRKKGGDKPFALRFEEENELEEDEDGDEPKERRIDRTDTYVDLMVYGVGIQLNNNGAPVPTDDPGSLDLWKSNSFHFGIGAKTRLGNPYSKLYIKYGIELSAHNFRLKGNNQITTDSTGSTVFAEDNNVDNFDKSKYYISYFNVPVMLQLDFSEVGERDESFTIGVGGYGGLRITSKRELEYSTAQFEKVEEKSYADFNTNAYRYGLMGQVGYGSFKVTASYDLNNFFEANRGPQYNMLNVAVGFTF